MATHYLFFRPGRSLFPSIIAHMPSIIRSEVQFNPRCSIKSIRLLSTLVKNSTKHTCVPQKHVLNWRNRLHSATEERKIKARNTMYYSTAFVILVGGCTYLSVLLYRLYCQTTGKGGQAVVEEAGEKVASMKSIKNRNITVNFNADVNSTLRWNFKPQQSYIKVSPGETALAFYTAKNPMDTPITGVATYNVLPFEAGKYFNKIQCFCFEEQQLNPHEEVDMPVFFYLDPEYAEDPRLETVNDIILSYTFFEAKEGIQLPKPSFM